MSTMCELHGKDCCAAEPIDILSTFGKSGYLHDCYQAAKTEIARLESRIVEMSGAIAAEQQANLRLREGLGSDVAEGALERVAADNRKQSDLIRSLQGQLQRQAQTIEILRKRSDGAPPHAVDGYSEEVTAISVDRDALNERCAQLQGNYATLQQRYEVLLSESASGDALTETVARLNKRNASLEQATYNAQLEFRAARETAVAAVAEAQAYRHCFELAHGVNNGPPMPPKS